MYRTDAPTPLALALLVAAFTVASLVAVPSSASAQSNDQTRSLRACDGYMELYARSAARKLARALSGQGYALETVELPDRLSTDNRGQSVTFATFAEKDGRAVGLVDADRRARRSFVVVGTEEGLVVTSHTWPSRDAISGGQRCLPVHSQIESPDVAVRSVDVEPFKYWGLRISWHLPESFDVKPGAKHDAFVREVIHKTMTRSAEPTRNDESEQQKTGGDDDSDKDEASD